MESIVLTGAAGGMGYATARMLSALGYRVFALDVREAEPMEGVTFLSVDLTDPDAVRQAYNKVAAACDRIRAIVNMAGIYDLNSLLEMDEAAFVRIFNVNLFSAYRVNKTFFPLLDDGGRIVMISSELAPLDPLPFTGIYGITKSAVEKYADSLRMELQLLGHRVTVIRPGAVDTGLLSVSTDRLADFTAHTSLYACNAARFQTIVDRVEARKIPPEAIAKLVVKAIRRRRPKAIYRINRNPLLLLLNALPRSWQRAIIRKILAPPAEKND